VPKWSFGSAPRFKFKSGQVDDKQINKSKSSPALANTSVTTFANSSVSTFAEESSADFVQLCSARSDVSAALAEPSAGGGGADALWRPMDATATMCRSAQATRLEGSLDRAAEPRQRAAHPRAKSYGPAETLGHGTSATIAHAPRYSFGGGKSRMPPEVAIASLSPTPAGGKTMKPDAWLQPRRRKQLCRGFGMEVRLRYRGGAMELPISPGPAAYEVPREADPTPVWARASLSPWGRRTAQRPEMVNATATDAGPGEHTAHHPMVAAAPSPVIGLKIGDVTRDNFPDPAAYDLPTSIGAGPAFGIDPGPRSKWQAGDGPGPGAYDPSVHGVDPNPYRAVFGTSARRHESEEVDPDEPPGPGAHRVRRDPKASDKPSVGMPRADSRKHVVGMGPQGIPGPGTYQVRLGLGKHMGVHFPLTRGPNKNPGPGEYDPSDHLQRATAPTPNPLHYTAPRKPPFGNEGTGTEKASEAMLRRCAVEVARKGEDSGLITRQRDDKLIAFSPSGPSHSFGFRRPGVDRSGDACQSMYGAATSIG